MCGDRVRLCCQNAFVTEGIGRPASIDIFILPFVVDPCPLSIVQWWPPVIGFNGGDFLQGRERGQGGHGGSRIEGLKLGSRFGFCGPGGFVWWRRCLFLVGMLWGRFLNSSLSVCCSIRLCFEASHWSSHEVAESVYSFHLTLSIALLFPPSCFAKMTKPMY